MQVMYIADIADGLHRKSDTNEAREVMRVLQDHGSSEGMATKQFLIICILSDRQITAVQWNIGTPV